MFPILIDIFAFTCNANRELISVLCRLGISVSYSMILAQLHVLAADSNTQLRLLGAFDPEIGPQFFLLFDNVNKMKRAWRASLGHQDEVKNGTASTAIRLEGLKDDIDWAHIRGVGMGFVLRIWLKYIVFLVCHKAAVEELFTSKRKKHRLKLRKSDIYSTRLTGIEESTTVGAAAVLWNLVIGQMRIIPTMLYRWMIMICGDQLSIDRIRKIKEYTQKYGDPFQRHEWVLPSFQLWHLKWNWQKNIFKLHLHPELGKNIFGLHPDCEKLERKFNPENRIIIPDITFWRTGVKYGPEVKLTDAVSMYLSPEGKLLDCSFERLQELAKKAYLRYMCTSAAENALGHSDRDPEIYGEAWNANPDVEMDSEDETQEMPPLVSIGSSPKPPPSKKRKTRAKASAQPGRNFSGGDQVMVTFCHFMRVTFWYLEVCAAIAEGDIGRVFEIIKACCPFGPHIYLTKHSQVLRFSFWGAGSTNYGNELLELACNFLYKWSDDLWMTVLENYLVNSTGRIGHWFELDLLQEHFNFGIKNLFNSKSHDFDGKHLSEAVGLNITGISSMRERFPALFGLKKNGQKHRKVSAVDDINTLGAHFHKEHILQWESGRN
ncbi:hypothetical protein B0H17DRAFT_1331568 [Mycena rosella]|uniref:DUF6589 domain-containing protein n=1 Tax=Mycena rosella TaxID=1033263 RepID=A0AAD7DFN2_MYCRO|nr:hypothetical protein B0H17DRAFT_1331568 [Mycena rosella]